MCIRDRLVTSELGFSETVSDEATSEAATGASDTVEIGRAHV